MTPNKCSKKSTYGTRAPSKVARMIPASPHARKCPEIERQMTALKRDMAREFGSAISGQSQMLNCALNEAEAMAWQTGYPHLLFPVLAQEKAFAVTRWAARQRSVRRATRQICLSA